MSKILFSPVGGTDPISRGNYHDGSLLQIARKYQPDIIYLYMSKEMLELQEKDDRYRYCLRELGKLLGHSFTIYEIERPDLVDVQLFNWIYSDFRKELEKIIDEMGDSDELLLNISSGTPSMKSALLVLATMIDIPCKCIQVDTPERAMNDHSYGKGKELTIEEQWELNYDNEYHPDAKERTHEEELISLKKLKYEASIKEFVNSYDYHAAVTLAKDMKAEDAPYFQKLQLADARQRLDLYTVDILVKQQDPAIYSPVRNEASRTIYEYMLMLQAKVKQGNYADFARAISPLIVDLYEEILKKQAGISLSDYTFESNGVVRWDMNKLLDNNKIKEILDASYNNGRFNGGWVKSIHMYTLIKGLIKEPAVLECVDKLRTVEGNVRNTAAHNMVSVSDAWVKKKTGLSSEEIITQIRKAFTFTSYNIRSSEWDSYERMNEDIISSIKAVQD